MVKNNNMRSRKIRVVVKPKLKIAKRKRKQRKAPPSGNVFGPITTIDTAPVAIGNSYQGARPVVTPFEDGVRVRGRDFLLSVDSTAGSVTTWTLVGAAPFTPACMSATVLKQYAGAYAEYCVHAVAYHFITSSTTAESGNIMLYVNKDRMGPGLITSSQNFLPVVLSDHNTFIGPIWKNNSGLYLPEQPEWLSTDVGMFEEMRHQASAELHVFSKTNVTDSPGFILIDYDISFKEMQFSPRNLTLPIARMKYTQVVLRAAAAGASQHSPVRFDLTGGTLLDGSTASAAPVGSLFGDVYKVIMNFTNASTSNATTSTIFEMQGYNSVSQAVTVTDGFTAFLVYQSSTSVQLYLNEWSALTVTNYAQWGVTISGGTTVTIPAYISYVGSVGNPGMLQSNY